jgi:hypothetical protein
MPEYAELACKTKRIWQMYYVSATDITKTKVFVMAFVAYEYDAMNAKENGVKWGLA